MPSTNMIKALNDQISEEMHSSYLYLAMAADLEAKNWLGSAAWFKKQSSEEWAHAMKIWEYLNDVGGKVVLDTLKAAKVDLKSIAEAFDSALAHEKHISACIHNLVRLARKEDDLPTENFLQWFVSEQVEEEKTAAEIVAKIGMIGTSPSSLYLLDKELGKLAAGS